MAITRSGFGRDSADDVRIVDGDIVGPIVLFDFGFWILDFGLTKIVIVVPVEGIFGLDDEVESVEPGPCLFAGFELLDAGRLGDFEVVVAVDVVFDLQPDFDQSQSASYRGSSSP